MSQLSEPVTLGDVADVEAFVNGCLNDSGIEFQTWEREDLVAEGICIMFELFGKFEPHRPGYAQAGRFSGFAAFYLPKKLGDAWHRGRPEHRYVTGEDGKRQWKFFKAHVSLDGVLAGDGKFARGDGTSVIQAEASLIGAAKWVPVAAAA